MRFSPFFVGEHMTRKLKDAPMPDRERVQPGPVPERKPKIGDLVFYTPDVDDPLYSDTREAVGAIPSDSSREYALAAQVSWVLANGNVNLFVLSVNGTPAGRTDVERKKWKFRD
jgi:hypothetical protein